MFARVRAMMAMEYSVVYHLERCSCHTWVLSVGRFKHWVLICGGIPDSFTVCRKLFICIGHYRSEDHGNKPTVPVSYQFRYPYDMIFPASHTVLPVLVVVSENETELITNTELQYLYILILFLP